MVKYGSRSTFSANMYLSKVNLLLILLVMMITCYSSMVI